MSEHTSCTIAPIAHDDLPALAELYGQLAERRLDHEAMGPVFSRMAANPDYFLLGAKSPEGRLVGTIMGLLCHDLATGCRPIMMMENMVVHRDHHRTGVGRRLVERLEAIAREHNCYFIQFCSSSFRTGAHRFYHAAGYDPDLVKGFRKFF